MKKALLKKIPVVEAGIKDKQYMELCRQNYLMKVQKATVAHKRTLILNRNYSEPALLKDEIRVTCDRIFDCFVSIVSLFMCRAYVGHDF